METRQEDGEVTVDVGGGCMFKVNALHLLTKVRKDSLRDQFIELEKEVNADTKEENAT